MKRSKCSGIIKNILYPHFMEDVTAAGHYGCVTVHHDNIHKKTHIRISLVFNGKRGERLIAVTSSTSHFSCHPTSVLTDS
ncbi:hypothetical protein E2C01_033496 [Portunus trituberculatus]|uniref:Uncharacterized protein n=1 Tax=Portunus trituberculatus TaxID=210409 RepID=A0A5B7F4C4_PORTR|nr:hypothetical protein [Portunus trituberculatus]